MGAIVFCFAFSISIILCTIGLMDGFEYTLKGALKLSNGDLTLHSPGGFFSLDKAVKDILEKKQLAYSPLIQTEGFLVREGLSKGVMVRGVEQESFSQVSGLGLQLEKNQMAIGKELAKAGQLKPGDKVFLAIITKKGRLGEMPTLYDFEIKQILDHKIYDKNMRLTYVNLAHLQSLLGIPSKVNLVAVNQYSPQEPHLVTKVTALQKSLQKTINEQADPLMRIRPFWQEFAPLLEAVEIEKLVITLILQLIVVIAIFNIIAFVTFLNQQKAREIFLFQALGVSRKQITLSWIKLLLVVWACSCTLSLGFSTFFEWAMLNLDFLQLPGEVYSLGRIQVHLSPSSYGISFFLALLWLLAISWPGLKKLQQKSLLSQIRSEFS